MKAKVEKLKGRYYAVLPTKEALEIKSKKKYSIGENINGSIVLVKRQYWSDMTPYFKKVRLFKVV